MYLPVVDRGDQLLMIVELTAKISVPISPVQFCVAGSFCSIGGMMARRCHSVKRREAAASRLTFMADGSRSGLPIWALLGFLVILRELQFLYENIKVDLLCFDFQDGKVNLRHDIVFL